MDFIPERTNMSEKLPIEKSKDIVVDIESAGTTSVQRQYNDVTENLSNSSPSGSISLLAVGKVLMFSKTSCPFCIELKRTLGINGIAFAVVEVDRLKGSGDIKNVLFNLYAQKTYPMLIVDGVCFGTCDAIKVLENARDLACLAPYMSTPQKKENGRRLKCTSFFWFPTNVNNNAVRVGSGVAVLICLLCIAFFRRRVTPWVVLALAIDYFLRLLYGSSPSIIGMFSNLLVSPWEPDFRSGPPKQFAVACGVFFSAFSAALFLSGERVGGAVVLGCLMGAAFLEVAFDFCVGCFFFGLGITIGLIPPQVYRAPINLKPNFMWAWKFSNKDENNYPRVFNEHLMLPGQLEPTAIDLMRKDRLETEYKNKDFGVIRHTKVEYYGMPMSIAALAYAYSLLSGSSLITSQGGVAFDWGFAPRAISHALIYCSATIFVLLSIVYLTRTLLYNKKVFKEWNHPTNGNMFTAISICLSLYGLLILPYDRHYGIVLIWIGALFQMILSVTVVSRLVFEHQAYELLNPSIIMAPVGNFVSAIALAAHPFDDRNGQDRISSFGVNYVFIARGWFAVAALFAITMFIITFAKSLADTHADVRVRPTLWIWQAASSIAGPAFYAVSGGGAVVGTSLPYQFFFLISAFFFALNCVGWMKGFYSYCPDMSIWIMAFSNCALAITTIHYYSFVVGNMFMMIVVVITMAIASTSCAVCLLYSALWTIDGTLFKPRPKWGPLSFMKLTHEAFRVAIPQLALAVKNLDVMVPCTINLFLSQMEPFLLSYAAHADHEEKVLFPAARALFPNLNPSMSEEHLIEHAVVAHLSAATIKLNKHKVLPDSPVVDRHSGKFLSSLTAEDAINLLKSEFPNFGDHLLAHMRNEESTITVVMRKYLSIERQKELCRESFSVTTSEDWHIILPYILSSLPHPVWKVRFLRTFIWAMPERAQEIGLIIYRGCDSMIFAFLAEEIPEIIPRGAYNYHKKY